ncbi:hypothetical protein ACQ4PT_020584 [Festuca glaucescens]
MGDLLGRPRERVSYLAYPNLFGTKSLEKKKISMHVAGLVRNSRETIRRLPITSDAKLRLRDLAKLCLVLSRSFSRPTELTGSLANINKADQLIRHVIPQVDAGDSPTVAARSFSTPMSGAEQMDIHVPAGKASRCLPGAAGAAAHQ